MRQVLLLAITTAFALSLGGCGLTGGGESTAESSDPATVAAAPASEATDPEASISSEAEANAQDSEAFDDPTVPGQANSKQPEEGGGRTVSGSRTTQGTMPTDLIRSTNPEQRLRAIQRNRPDPFSLVPTTPTIERPAELQPNSGSSNVLPQTVPVTPAQPATLAPIPQLVPVRPPASRTPIAVAPQPQRPQPELARAVEVTGVVQIGGTVYAIVNAPNEPSSRYVQVGQRLAEGQVLVRRIDAAGDQPVVVLEQFGVEVVKAIGSANSPTTPAPAGTQPAASSPIAPAST